MLYVNIHRPSGETLLEDQKGGDESIELRLSDRAVKCLTALSQLDSFEVAQALGELFMLGVKTGHRTTRRRAKTA